MVFLLTTQNYKIYKRTNIVNNDLHVSDISNIFQWSPNLISNAQSMKQLSENHIFQIFKTLVFYAGFMVISILEGHTF